MPSSIASASSSLAGARRKGDVLEHLDQHSAEPERDDLAEAWIGQRADDYFVAAGEHLLDEDAIDFRARVVLLGIADDRLVGLLRFRGGFHSDDDAARVGFMQDVGRDDFHRDRKSDRASDPNTVRGGGRDFLFWLCDPVRRAQRFCIRRERATCAPRL